MKRQKKWQLEKEKWQEVINYCQNDSLNFCSKAEKLTSYLKANGPNTYTGPAKTNRYIYLQKCSIETQIKEFLTKSTKHPFMYVGNGVIFDRSTGLYWYFFDSQVEFGRSITYDEAKSYVNHLQVPGFQNWRLPEIKELQTIFNLQHPNAINFAPHYFASTSMSPDNIPLVYTDGNFKGSVGRIETYVNYRGYVLAVH